LQGCVVLYAQVASSFIDRLDFLFYKIVLKEKVIKTQSEATK
jgi:hypothetical protein